MRQSVRDRLGAVPSSKVTIALIALGLVAGSIAAIYLSATEETEASTPVSTVRTEEPVRSAPTARAASDDDSNDSQNSAASLWVGLGLVTVWVVGFGVVLTRARRRGQPATAFDVSR